MTLDLQVQNRLNKEAQIVKDEEGNTSALVLTDHWVGIGTDPEHVAEHREIDGPGTTFIVQRKSSEKIATQNVTFKMNPTEAVFNLDVSGKNNSRARIHLGDAAEPHNDVTMLGDVGIGTTDPQAKLDVQGDVHIEKSGSPTLTLWSRGSGTQRYTLRATNNEDAAGGRNFVIRNEDRGRDDLLIDTSGNVHLSGEIKSLGADCAEDFDVIDTVKVEPGTVMAVTATGILAPCTEAYDRKAAGVVSGAGAYRPGIVLDQRNNSSNPRQPIALMGKVYCKVDADYGAIEVGDLLTTSATVGHAMKAADAAQAFGAVVGKALEPLEAGQGMIPIIVALQ